MAIKKGFFFTLDALLAASILLGGLILLSSHYVEERPIVHLNYLSQDIISCLDNLLIDEVSNDYVDLLIANGTITNLNNTVLQQIGEFWAFEEFGIAEEFSENLTSGMLTERVSFAILVNNDMVYKKNGLMTYTRSTAKKMISGYERKRPIDGTSSRTYLSSLKERRAASYVYFGGFVGQGNISKEFEFIPENAQILSSFIEFDVSSSFDAYINGNLCGSFSPVSSNMNSTRWNTSSCNNLFLNNTKNNLSIIR